MELSSECQSQEILWRPMPYQADASFDIKKVFGSRRSIVLAERTATNTDDMGHGRSTVLVDCTSVPLAACESSLVSPARDSSKPSINTHKNFSRSVR